MLSVEQLLSLPFQHGICQRTSFGEHLVAQRAVDEQFWIAAKPALALLLLELRRRKMTALLALEAHLARHLLPGQQMRREVLLL